MKKFVLRRKRLLRRWKLYENFNISHNFSFENRKNILVNSLLIQKIVL